MDAHVIDLTHLAVVDNEINGLAMVLYIQPFADIQPLISRNLMITLDTEIRKSSSPHDVCLQEYTSIFERAVNMALSSKLDYKIGKLFPEHLIHSFLVADIFLHQTEIGFSITRLRRRGC